MKRSTKEVSDSDVLQLIKGNLRLGRKLIVLNFYRSLSIPTTTRTISRYLKDLILEYLIEIKKQWLSIRH